jgi:sugar lactone lactonase YvrE
MSFPFECALDIKASLGECPVWSVEEQALYWVDINAPSLNRFDPATGSNTAWPMPRSIGCFALRRRGGFIVALRDGLWLASQNGRLERKVAEAPYDPTHHRFNDGRADAGGRLWAGSMNESRDASTGALYCFDPDGVLVQVIPDMTISNGLAFSPDGRTMYHADTPKRSVDAYDFDVATGTLANRRAFARFPGETDRPDGAAVDSDGCYWSAFYRGGKVVRLSPQGERVAEYAVPAMCPTMCAFGGSDLRTLYVTSARQMRDAEELARLPLSGGIFAMRVHTPGMPEPKFAG